MINEAILTGESIPVLKAPLAKVDEKFSFINSKRHIMYEGTKVVQYEKTFENFALGLVVRTGFSSLKGIHF
jgi:cation-transporting P-type ATPase 13A2